MEPAPETLASLFQHRRRRWTVDWLAKQDDALHIADLARDLARFESASDEEASVDTESLYVRLYHTHLPKLHEADVVTFDADAKVASLAVDEDSVAPYLGDLPARTRWPRADDDGRR